MAGAVVAGIVVVMLTMFVFSQMITQPEAQRAPDRRDRELEKSIEEIDGLERQKERLLARMEIIEQLQKSRPGDRAPVRRDRSPAAGRRLPDRHEAVRDRASRCAASRSRARACRH